MKLPLRNEVARGMKTGQTEEMLGCSYNFFKHWITVQFTPEMNWENQGTYWHYDHTIPLSSFDKENINIANGWCNFQPLEAKKNLSISNSRNIMYEEHQMFKANAYLQILFNNIFSQS